MTIEEMKRILIEDGWFTIGDRDPRLNTDYPGRFMVVESCYEDECELPTKDGSNGPWCIVGDDLDALVREAYRIWEPDIRRNGERALKVAQQMDGTSGQDRESYSDTQDRNSYYVP